MTLVERMLNVKPQLTGQFVAVQVAGLETLILSVINVGFD